MPPRRNYGFEKRQKDQARKDKREEKAQRKRERAQQGEDGLPVSDDAAAGVEPGSEPGPADADATGTDEA